MKYKLAVFDLDGTVLDTLEDLHDSLNYALTACGYPPRTLSQVRAFVGNGIRNLMGRGVPEGTPETEIEKVLSVFTPHYKLHCQDKTRPYEGVTDFIAGLRKAGYKTAVVSNKDDYAVQLLCDRFFAGLFDCAVGSRAGIGKKPCPDSVNEVLAKLDTARCDAVYIGDSEVDIQTAANAGLACITVLWGFRDRDFLLANGAKELAADLTQLGNLL